MNTRFRFLAQRLQRAMQQSRLGVVGDAHAIIHDFGDELLKLANAAAEAPVLECIDTKVGVEGRYDVTARALAGESVRPDQVNRYALMKL